MENNVSMEKFTLNGQYTIIENYFNKEYTGDEVVNIDCGIGTIYHAKKAFYRGNILCKTDDPNAIAMIELMVKSSCATKPLSNFLDLPDLDTSKAKKEQMKWGTICPTKEEVFQYKNYKFNLYGRYIYGFEQCYVRFVNTTSQNKLLEVAVEHGVKRVDNRQHSDMENKDSLYEKDYVIPPNSLNDEEIILATITDPTDKYLNEYNYCFSIVDVNNILVAFAIYK